jgi:two-component system OmpR family response regulator
VLVVDDSALIRHAARIALEQVSGFEVLTAGSAEDGLAAAAGADPDAILLDLVMPGTDGMAVARQLAACPSTRSIPVVMMTATDTDAFRNLLDSVPARGLIAKPFEVTALGDQLRSLLGWSA